ncbi:MAG: MBL fold metallo-hydrolase [Candidatus Aminicenantes bacterium]|nr:MBL fold metallo-hydrolase [Candidatus Aminicenantes bacterium]
MNDLSGISLKRGEAAVWYLFHTGWAVKTKNTFLIFDYWNADRNTENPSLSTGFIDPDEIKNEDVYVFVSHGHGDHYDPIILEWEKTIPDITYIFGWDVPNVKNKVIFGQERAIKKIGPLIIKNIYHEFDNIPESAFLIEVDDLTIYFSGDHGNGPNRINPIYKENIDYISGLADKYDLVFLSIFGDPTYPGEFYALEKFKSIVTLPMHRGGREKELKDFFDSARSKFPQIGFWLPGMGGDGFLYRDGRITSRKR